MSDGVNDQGWDVFYTRGTPAPWDHGSACAELVDLVGQHVRPGARILEVGCGTGQTAIHLARQGYAVVAIDIAPSALQLARQAADRAAAKLDWRLEDFMSQPATGTYAAVLDRGVFHIFRDADAVAFARQVADSLTEGGLWISICGSCDDRTEPTSFPKTTVTNIARAVEQFFEIDTVQRCGFAAAGGHSFSAWVCLFRKRPGLASRDLAQAPQDAAAA